MADHRVVGTDKEDINWGVRHRHIAVLCLDTGARVSKVRAISDIGTRRETYWTLADGQRANVLVVPRCANCGSSYLRTDRDTTTRNNLLSLPDCSGPNLLR